MLGKPLEDLKRFRFRRPVVLQKMSGSKSLHPGLAAFLERFRNKLRANMCTSGTLRCVAWRLT